MLVEARVVPLRVDVVSLHPPSEALDPPCKGRRYFTTQPPGMDQIAQQSEDRRADGHPRCDRVRALSGLEDVDDLEEDDAEALHCEIASHAPGPLAERCARGADVIGTAAERDEPVAELPGHPRDLRPKGGDIDRDRAVEINDAPIRMEEADLPHDVALAIFDRLAAQQPFDGADVVPKVARLHRREAHRSPTGVPGAQAKGDTSWVELVQSGDRVSSNGGNPRRCYGDPCAQAHLSCALRTQRHD